jgi:hypothetical protein
MQRPDQQEWKELLHKFKGKIIHNNLLYRKCYLSYAVVILHLFKNNNDITKWKGDRSQNSPKPIGMEHKKNMSKSRWPI